VRVVEEEEEEEEEEEDDCGEADTTTSVEFFDLQDSSTSPFAESTMSAQEVRS